MKKCIIYLKSGAQVHCKADSIIVKQDDNGNFTDCFPTKAEPYVLVMPSEVAAISMETLTDDGD